MMPKEKERGPVAFEFDRRELGGGTSMDEQREAERKAAEHEWQNGRRKLIMAEFVCPHCGHMGCSPISEIREVTITEGGLVGGRFPDIFNPVIKGWYCTSCTVQFQDPVKFAKNSVELVAKLAGFDLANKPKWLA